MGIIKYMNTDDPNQITPSKNNQQQSTESTNDNDSSQSVADLVDALQSVDTNTPEAALNATSIEDNNGDRIELNQDGEVIKK